MVGRLHTSRLLRVALLWRRHRSPASCAMRSCISLVKLSSTLIAFWLRLMSGWISFSTLWM